MYCAIMQLFKCLDKREVHMNDQEIVKTIADGFKTCSKMLVAIGDETRQHLILEMIKMGKCEGVRVSEITERTNLSRPAVSHHLQIMKDAGIVRSRKEGTKIYYYFDPEMEVFSRLVDTLTLAMELTKSLPDRRGE